MTNRLFDYLLPKFQRTERIVNRADPTAVTTYRRRGRLDIELVSSWGVALSVRLFGRSFRSYDSRPAQWVFGGLEDAYYRWQLQFDNDPMGRGGDYL